MWPSFSLDSDDWIKISWKSSADILKLHTYNTAWCYILEAPNLTNGCPTKSTKNIYMYIWSKSTPLLHLAESRGAGEGYVKHRISTPHSWFVHNIRLIFQWFWNFAQYHGHALYKISVIGLLQNKLWTNKTSQDLSFWCALDWYPIVHKAPGPRHQTPGDRFNKPLILYLIGLLKRSPGPRTHPQHMYSCCHTCIQIECNPYIHMISLFYLKYRGPVDFI